MDDVTVFEFPTGQILSTDPISLYLLILFCLVHCFFGYVLYRMFLVGYGLLIGTLLGAVAASYLRPAGPSGLDYFVACSVGCIVLGIATYLGHRLIFALVVGAAGFAVAALGAYFVHQPPTLHGWMLAGGVGVGIAIVAFLFEKIMVVLLTSLLGGIGAVLAAWALIGLRPGEEPDPKLVTDAEGWGAIVVLGVGLIVSLAGVYTQYRLAGRLQRVFAAAEEVDQSSPRGAAN